VRTVRGGGGFRDPANVRRELREARGEELAWITPHTFRTTAATILDEAAVALEASSRVRSSRTKSKAWPTKKVSDREGR